MSNLANQPTADGDFDRTAATRVEQLYASHAALVRSVCRSVLRDRMEAEDAVQQTFLSAQRALRSGSSPRDAEAWLVTIARHESFGRVRARMREPLPIDAEAEATGPDAYAVAVQRHAFSELRDALAELPAQQREAVLLREMRGLSYEEVASTLSVTTSAVESLLFRARRNLRVRLRGALAAFSPGGLARELAARLGGGFAAPAAAKALVAGVGAAVVTSGAVVGPRMIGLGHAPQTGPTARAAHGVHEERHARVLVRDAPIRHETGDHSSGGEVGSGSGSSDRQESRTRSSSDGGGNPSSTSDSGSSGSSDGAATSSSGDAQTTHSGSDGTSTDSSSQTTTTTTTTSSGSDGSGETTTTTTSSGSDGSGETTTTTSAPGGA
jgi:RNA polymerase sigma-70 factor (ECF subfamily)